MSKSIFCNTCKGTCNNKIKIFSMRCETLGDSAKFLNKFMTTSKGDIVNFIINTEGYDYGCEVILNTHKSIDYVKFAISLCPDLHTMKDTIQDITRYTGVRKV